MRLSSIGLLTLSLAMGVVAVVGTRTYIASQAQPAAAPTVAKAPAVPTRKVVVAADDIAFGTALTDDRLRVADWATEDIPSGTFDTMKAFGGPDPRFARVNITAGEPLLAAKVTLPGVRPTLSSVLTGNNRAVTIRVDDVLGVAGLVAPGDRVDVLLTQSYGDSKQPSVDVLLQNVKVLALNQDAAGAAGGKRDLRTVTLEVAPPMAQKLALAGKVGTLSLSLRSGDGGDEAAERFTLADLLGREANEPPAASEPDRAVNNELARALGAAVGDLAGSLPGAAAALPASLSTNSGLDGAPKGNRTIEIYHGTNKSIHKVPG
ncbi:MAG: Flp pilus assembly protein CpaB [Pseudomonadota bacterium]